MKANRGFADDILPAIRVGKILGIRAGSQPHRFIGIWAVVVEGNDPLSLRQPAFEAHTNHTCDFA